jgi:hypothetical protein
MSISENFYKTSEMFYVFSETIHETCEMFYVFHESIYKTHNRIIETFDL